MSKLDNYSDLGQNYQRKLEQQVAFCKLNLINPQSLGPEHGTPLEMVSCKLLYLGYGRNAWHSTRINRYYPGSVSFFEKDLKDSAERRRVQGSSFRTSVRPALALKFKSDQLLMLCVNDKPLSSYISLLLEVSPFDLGNFWKSKALQVDNWLLTFRISGWRPDLWPERAEASAAHSQGSGRPLRWERSETKSQMNGFDTFSEDLVSRLLYIKGAKQGKTWKV
jgi:hypothetical protein